MPTRPLSDYQVTDLARGESVEVSKDAYLICQRLDRIIALLDQQSAPATIQPEYFNPPPVRCPRCGRSTSALTMDATGLTVCPACKDARP